MSRHAVHRTYVLQYSAAPDSKPPIPAPEPFSAASVNTHDMPPFAGFWQGKDIEDRYALRLMDESAAKQERRTRARIKRTLLSGLRRVEDHSVASQDASVVAKALMTTLASSIARLLLVNLEDLWGETRPQNVPGTTTERVNWRRKARYSLNEMKTQSAVTETLSAIDLARKRAG
jgi:4-alpha-glucanotransferase